MMSDYFFYPIFNLQEFEDSGLVSKDYNLDFTNIGNVDLLVTKGNLTSITYNGVIVSLDMNDKNPFEFDGYAIYLGNDGIVYFGINKDQYEN